MTHPDIKLPEQGHGEYFPGFESNSLHLDMTILFHSIRLRARGFQTEDGHDRKRYHQARRLLQILPWDHLVPISRRSRDFEAQC